MGTQNPNLIITDIDDEPPPPERYERLPGLFRRWELDQVLELGRDMRFEPCGEMRDGTPLFAAYRSRAIDRSNSNNATTPQRKGH